MDERRDPAERVKREIGLRNLGRERVHLDLVVGHGLLRQDQADDADVDAVAIAMKNEGHGAS